MTKKQVGSPTRTRLTPGTVVDAALCLLDEEGLESVTMRAVAARLGVRMNTVLWHVKTKRRLLELMADAVAATITYDNLPDEAGEQVKELMRRYRQSLLSRRDGAALVTGTYAAEPHTLRFADALLASLAKHESTTETSGRTLYALAYFTLGLTQEEQAMTDFDEARFREAAESGPYPSLRESLAVLSEDTFAARFEDGVRRILGAA
ncbi:TetR/AcrR family transcriptional regulator C-terminal domain-containing protein [Streptomyces sp. NPDC088747]|uniref:TetR/AcrR family transcriptional regulator C-terminal domain-containing protein n=1 Tax=Streptomyces sp. NPDC088747 TaxID=3365886 RepID=UPI0037FA7C35